ncbi:MAG: hypothetical protein IJ446_01985 [Oscillospiraceae bacterium]|nr:hypothetical protein [Oscillospiraceae bacterium]
MKWILDKNVDTKNLQISTVEIPKKSKILNYFKTYSSAIAYASSTVTDIITKSKTDIPNAMFTDSFFEWSSSIVYHFEKYNLKLTDEFIQHVLNNT